MKRLNFFKVNLFNNNFIKKFSEKIALDEKNPNPLTVDKSTIKLEKKSIYNKKTHYRTLEIDNQVRPPKDLEEQDEREMLSWYKHKLFDRAYVRIMDDWQKNLATSKRKKMITKLNFENYVF
jgi:hypothetical protein